MVKIACNGYTLITNFSSLKRNSKLTVTRNNNFEVGKNILVNRFSILDIKILCRMAEFKLHYIQNQIKGNVSKPLAFIVDGRPKD
jgi:hypothetical protein